MWLPSVGSGRICDLACAYTVTIVLIREQPLRWTLSGKGTDEKSVVVRQCFLIFTDIWLDNKSSSIITQWIASFIVFICMALKEWFLSRVPLLP